MKGFVGCMSLSAIIRILIKLYLLNEWIASYFCNIQFSGAFRTYFLVLSFFIASELGYNISFYIFYFLGLLY